MKLNYLDAFSGIGGFHRGLEEAGVEFDWVGFSEINPHAKTIYRRHYPDAEDLGDVRTIIAAGRIPARLDLFTFGFPCQDLSVAGRREGIHAARSGLFFEALKIVEAARPTVFIFENVKGLLSSGGWRDFKTLLRAIADLGLYDCEWQLLNTRWLLPQNRERVYFVGHLRGKSSPKVFPFIEGDSDVIELQRLLQGQIQAQREDRNGRHVDGQPGRENGDIHQGDAVRVHSLQPRSPDRPAIRNGTSSGGSGPLSRADGNVYCLDTGNSQAIELRSGIRRPTPLECERLQGFPDDWTAGLSDNQKYRCLGNAVSVAIVRAIGRRLFAGEPLYGAKFRR